MGGSVRKQGSGRQAPTRRRAEGQERAGDAAAVGRTAHNNLSNMTLDKNKGVSSASSRVITAPFVLAVVLLGLTALLSGPVATRLGIRQAKEALPLKTSLARFDEGALGPYRVVERVLLPPEIIEALGTDQYLSWVLEDSSVPPTDPLRYANLFITYDTGGRSLAPHKPDLCYLGSGYEPAQAHENIDFELSALPIGFGRVPVRVCTFVKTALKNREKQSVVYTFFANGRFAATSYGVRRLSSGLTNRYAFFSKVEIKFPKATREQCVAGAEKLYNTVLPTLIRDHWPDYEAAEREAREQD